MSAHARRVLAVIGTIAAVIGVSWGTAFASWLTPSTDASGRATALAMPAGANVTAPATSTGSVTLSWAVADLGGSDLTAYTVRRYPAAGGAGTVIPCPQTITNRLVSCTYTETTAGSYQFTNAPQHANWVGAESAKSAATAVTLTTTRTFTVTTPAGNRTAGQAFNVTLTAMTNGVVDTAYTGSHTIAFTGPGTSPTGQAPVYPATVSFTAGVGTASVTLYRAQSVTLTASEASPARSGSTTVTVNAGGQNRLGFSTACPATNLDTRGTWVSAVDILDQWGNPTVQGPTAQTVNVTLSNKNHGGVSTDKVTVAAGANPARSGTFTYTGDTAKDKATVLTVSVTGNTLAAATCSLTT